MVGWAGREPRRALSVCGEVRAIRLDMEAAAFRKLYPEEFLDRFLSQGLRPDGRRPTKARAASTSFSAVTTARGSALVKLGGTTVVTAIELRLVHVDDDDANAVDDAKAGAPSSSSSVCPVRCHLDTSPLGAHGHGHFESAIRMRQRAARIDARVASTLAGMLDPADLVAWDAGPQGARGRWVWRLDVRPVCLALDGCLFDAVW